MSSDDSKLRKQVEDVVKLGAREAAVADAALRRFKELVDTIEQETAEYSYEGDAIERVKKLAATCRTYESELLAAKQRIDELLGKTVVKHFAATEEQIREDFNETLGKVFGKV